MGRGLTAKQVHGYGSCCGKWPSRDTRLAPQSLAVQFQSNPTRDRLIANQAGRLDRAKVRPSGVTNAPHSVNLAIVS